MFEQDYDVNTHLLKPVFIDVGTIADEELLTHQETAGAELAFKHIFSKNLEQYVDTIAQSLRHNDDNTRTHVLKYMLHASEARNGIEIMRRLTAALPDEENLIMTIAEQLRQEGEHEKAIWIAKNILSKNADVDFVKEVTGLSDQDIAKLIKVH